jgi:hypothetical protein
MIATSVIPGIALTAARLRTPRAEPLIVGGRQTIVGLAPATSRSIANRLRPVTMSRASTRRWGVPTTRNCERGLSWTFTLTLCDTAASSLSAPNEMVRPPVAVITPSRIVSADGTTSSCLAAASSSRPRAIAAATRTGVKIECIVFDPPVIWFQISSGRASASVTFTRDTGTSISSAIVIATAVVMPWPTSARGIANETVPSGLTTIAIRFAVGRAASVSRSDRS